MVKRIRSILGVVLAAATVILAIAVTATIVTLREGALEVRVAKDDLYWSIHQIEVEVMNMLIIAHALQHGDHLPEDLDIRYSVLLSRTDLFKKGEFREAISVLPKTQALMTSVTYQIEALSPLFDNAVNDPDPILPELIDKLDETRRIAHELTLIAHQEQVTLRVAKRDELANIFFYAEVLLSVLAVTVLIGFISLYWLMYLAKQAKVEADFHRRRAEANSDAKSRFLSNMSHELRTPLNAVMGFAQLMQMESRNLSREQMQNIDEIYKASEHLLSLINDIMDLSKIESGQLSISIEPCSVQSLVNESVSMIRSMAMMNNISVYEPEVRLDYLIKVDRTRMVQVLTNFLTNAIKYNRKGGWVKVELEHESRSGMLCLSVADNGIGIHKKDHHKVFKPFERLAQDMAIEGTGIGLALSQQLVLLMNGQIGFKSKEGQGSLFWVKFPILDVVKAQDRSAIKAVSPRPPDLEVLAAPKATVLYIEDNYSNIRLMESLFASMRNIQLLTTNNGEQGIAMARTYRPQLVLLDLNLPTTSGLDVCSRFQEDPELADIPIVAVTANVNGSQEASRLGLKFQEFILKPIDVEVMKSTIFKYLGRPQPH
ncbi:Signal transduction histidine kinase [Hahella chejuensis KCTC 2396]|uniref:histidine kinase n=1 Tax=Hahella chejuensis (strain KCTC 2396) TaxID=349521 RepID=Q2S7P6_HAHCH|nr:ATP-binding protein [Hahella chejuensis]ABC33328.1 Signal transduction histidine kinase [Hahella chejuensis KCTC 2396]